MQSRPGFLFAVTSAGVLLLLFFRAVLGQHLLAPLDLAPELFKHYAWMNPERTGVPANHYIIDQLTYDLPLQREIHQAVKEGTLPWWSSLDLAGRPLLADAHVNGTDPVRLLLYFLLPFERAYNLTQLLHSWLAGIGAFLLLRSLGSRPLHAGLLALTWQFSGPMTLYFGHPWIQGSFIYYPFLWMGWNRLARGFSAAALGASTLCVALVFLAGNLQSHAYLPLFAVAWLTGNCWMNWAQWRRLLPAVAVSGILGAIIVAPVLGPELDLYRQSQRLPAMSFRLIDAAAGPASLTCLFPWLLGTFKTVDLSKLFGQTALGYQLFVGFPVGLAALAALRRRRGADESPADLAAWRTGGLLVLGYLLVVATPAVLFLYTRIAPLATLGMVVLAARVLPWFEATHFPRLGKILIALGGAVLVGSSLIAFAVVPKFQPKIEAALVERGATGTFMDEAPELRRAQARRLAREISPANPELLAGTVSILAFGLFCLTPLARRRPVFAPVVWTIGIVPLLVFHSRFVPSHPVELWEKLMKGGPLQNEVSSLPALGALRFLDSNAGLHQQVFPNCFGHLYGVQTVHGYAALRPATLNSASAVPDLLPGRPLADAALAAPDAGESTLRIVRYPAATSSRWIFRTNGVPVADVVRSVRESPNRVEIDYEFPDPGEGKRRELIWTDTHAPGWLAQVAGQSVPLQRFERTCSRVELAAPKGTIELTYHPVGEGWPRWLALATALASAGLCLRGNRPRS